MKRHHNEQCQTHRRDDSRSQGTLLLRPATMNPRNYSHFNKPYTQTPARKTQNAMIAPSNASESPSAVKKEYELPFRFGF